MKLVMKIASGGGKIFLTLCCEGKEIANLARKRNTLKHRMLCVLLCAEYKCLCSLSNTFSPEIVYPE